MKITETLDQKRSEVVYLNDAMRSLIEDHDDLTDEQRAAFNDGKFLRDALIAEGIDLEARRSAIVEVEDVVRTDPDRIGSGDGALNAPNVIRGGVDPYDEDTIRSVGVDESFKRAVGDTTRVDASAQEELERKATLELADPEHMGGFKEYVLNLGSEDYARGWFKKVNGQSHRLTDAELYAEERASRFLTQRSVAIASDAAGAALIPIHLDPTVILTNAGANNPFRQISRVETGMVNVWNGVSSAGVAFVASTEGGDTTDGAPVFLDPSITAYKAHCTVPISFEAYGDIANIGQTVAMMFADAKDNYENTQFATGAGTAGPVGVVVALTTAGAGRISAHGTNSAFTTTDLINAQNKLGARWQPRASWVSSLTYQNRIRALGTDQYHTWSNTLDQGVSGNVLGKSSYEASAMDTALNTVTNNALVYGDFANYVIYDRVGMAVEFVPHLFSSAGAGILPNGKRAWHAWYRVGGDSVNDSGFVLSQNPGA